MWPDERREASWNTADRRHTRIAQTEHSRCNDGNRDGNQRRRRVSSKPFEAKDQREQGGADCDRNEGSVGQLTCDREQIAEEPRLFDVYAEQFRDLVHHDHQSDSRFETRQDRLGNEVGDETESQYGCRN